MGSKADEIREAALSDLEVFIRLVHPQRILGSIHKDLIRWWEREDHGSHQMVLLPRDHMKSALVAYRVAWYITKNPAIRILYISSTANLAEKQLSFIKNILTCPQYRKYWPEMVNEEEGKREKWTSSEISVDHPLRKTEAIRDPTIFTGGLTTATVGMHCDIAVLDDTVTGDNAYSQEGRDKVIRQYSLLASIEGADSLEWIVGTRYHPKDLYNELKTKVVEIFSEDGSLQSENPLYEVFQKEVETAGDGTGEYLWPRQQRTDGRWFGFDQGILAKKKAQYIDRTQFRAQYYNDPNDASTSVIQQSHFQRYDRQKLTRTSGHWYIQGKRLNIFAAIDFAYSRRLKADYSAIVVIGAAFDGSIYVLDIERFKTNKISDYFDKILNMHNKWDFRKLRCEVTAAQDVIVKDLKESYIKPYGLSLSILENKPNRHEGTKEERMEAVLQPKYTNLQMWHYDGGNCQLLEEELVLQNPPHDDIKDALANAIAIVVTPSRGSNSTARLESNTNAFHSRFGGIAF